LSAVSHRNETSLLKIFESVHEIPRDFYHKPLTMHELLAACSRTLSELWQAHHGESVLWRTRRVREAEIDPLVEVAAILSAAALLAAIP
jgi:hypothetical protein